MMLIVIRDLCNEIGDIQFLQQYAWLLVPECGPAWQLGSPRPVNGCDSACGLAPCQGCMLRYASSRAASPEGQDGLGGSTVANKDQI